MNRAQSVLLPSDPPRNKYPNDGNPGITYWNDQVGTNARSFADIFGTNKSIEEDSANFDIVVLPTIDDLKNVEVSNKDVFFYINDIRKILMT